MAINPSHCRTFPLCRHPRQESMDVARTAYLSSVFVRTDRTHFSHEVAGKLLNGNIGQTSTETSSKHSRTSSGSKFPSAVLSGLSFKAQFLRLVLWEAAGCYDNPGRQVRCETRCGVMAFAATAADSSSRSGLGSLWLAFCWCLKLVRAIIFPQQPFPSFLDISSHPLFDLLQFSCIFGDNRWST